MFKITANVSMSLNAAKELIDSIIKNERDPTELLQKCLKTEEYSNGHVYGLMIERTYEEQCLQLSAEFYNVHALLCFYIGNHKMAYDRWTSYLSLIESSRSISDWSTHFEIDDWATELNRIRTSMAHCVEKIKSDFEYYDEDRVAQLKAQFEKYRSDNVKCTYMITMTSCKRLPLFKRTVNSFINTCTDLHLIVRWVVVDDNSSSEDREEMSRLYPFIDFIWKSPEEKGHARSMNMIRNMLLESGALYNFGMEDDFSFYHKRPYITDLTKILLEDNSYGQALINPGYGETWDNVNYTGLKYMVSYDGSSYYLHDHMNAKDAINKYGNTPNCCYWPHYSLRPGLTRVKAYSITGEYNENTGHFEMEYAYRYSKIGYKTAFLSLAGCTHIGRLTKDRFKNEENAYSLNETSQFTAPVHKDFVKDGEYVLFKNYKIKTNVVNLDRRHDRFDTFLKDAKQMNFLNPARYSAVDGALLKNTYQLQKTFDTNDFGWRAPMIGCALSHIHNWYNLVQEKDENTIYLMCEDDITLVPEFRPKLARVLELMPDAADIVYLGHTYYPNRKRDEYYDKETYPVIELWDHDKSRTESMGGTFGYLITKRGALKLLQWINKNGVTNGIDWVMLRASSVLSVYYPFPHLIYSMCFDGITHIDSDIQRVHKSMKLTPSQFIDCVATELSEQYNVKLLTVESHHLPLDYSLLDKETLICIKDANLIAPILNEIPETYPVLIGVQTTIEDGKPAFQDDNGLNVINTILSVEQFDGGMILLPPKYKDFILKSRLKDFNDNWTVERMLKY